MTETDDQEPTGSAAAEPEAAPARPPVELRPALEAVLMIADEPLEHLVLAQAVGHPPAEVEQALRELAAEYTEQGRGFELRELAGGWRFYSREQYADVVAAFVLEGQQAKLSQAALETLAVVAYRQPISRSRISAIRGVNVDGVVRTLVTRGLIIELGHDGESGAILYGTTNYFLERMGLSGLDELPDLAPMLPDLEDLDSELERVAQQTAEREAVPAEPSADAAGDAPTDAQPTGDVHG